ncbi:MAG TPA: acetyl-CoA acetyltransferase, partial [Candidatus Binataceae bacterium]|nr:acetyl-CoA acetyltransferase [Candidatus Binataceae bacterium]
MRLYKELGRQGRLSQPIRKEPPMAKNSPVIAGVAQFNPRAAAMAEAPEPIEMMERVARAAAEDCGAPAILKSLDALAVVNLISFSYNNAPAALSARLGIDPKSKIYTTIGGNTPQYLVNHFAGEILSGKIRAAMIVGAEGFYTFRRAMKRGGVKWGANGGEGQPTIMGDNRTGTTDLEERYGARWPVQIYPLFENARRARHGWTIEEHRARLGAMCAAMSRVAAKNPYAWTPQERTAEQITTTSDDNRMIGFPYPKLMNANIDVDQAAAVIITSEEEAHRLGIAQSRLVYAASGAEATEIGYFITERENFHSSPAIKRVCEKSLELAGVKIGDVGCFDFYSCFPVVVGMAQDALGLDANDPRGVTVTGGLAFAGGPGNNYVTHSIAAMVERLRAGKDRVGLVTALGWYITKHAAGVYTAGEPPRSFSRDDGKVWTESETAKLTVRIVENAEGPATIETYTVVHDRMGAPETGIIVGRLENGARFIAHAP